MSFAYSSGSAARPGQPKRDGDSHREAAHVSHSARAPAVTDTGDYPELDCVRGLLPGDALAFAERRADRLGMGADRTLIAARLIREETYLRALGNSLGIAFEPLDSLPRAFWPLDDKAMVSKAATGLLPIHDGHGGPAVIVVAPQGTAVRGLIKLLKKNPANAGRFRLTTAERLNRFVMRGAHKGLIANAANGLQHRLPLLSARSRYGRWAFPAAAAIVVVLAIATWFAASVMLTAAQLLLSALFLAWLALRLIGAFVHAVPPPPDSTEPDHLLPVYSVIAALYREPRSVAGLLGALERLDYPPEKTDVIIAVEADDDETRKALAAVTTRFPITVVPVPPQGPRTKPKALNVALPFARGAYTVIYDAEDRPEPQQLRKALQAFRTGPGNLACVQSRLCVDNTDDGWLTGYFTAEYAGQFDVFLPGLASLGLPLPLGGSSNHFHTETLRKVGAWDPFNVTEDADLGMRLARFGYRTGMIESTTYEEAPARLAPWLRQRTRWFKGWMQTWLVHMRRPLKLRRQLGTAGFIAFNLMVGGNVLAALVHPLFVAALVYALSSSGELQNGDIPLTLLAALYAITAIAGYSTSIFLGWLGLARRGLASSAWVLLLTPLHWLLLSAAAWRALYQLFAAPFAWEKTEHGLARSSRRATQLAQALAGLERDLREAKADGRLPSINVPLRETFSDRRPLLRASA